MRIGAIGIDSSHLPEFTKRIQAMNADGKTRCAVTHFWDPGHHEWQHPDGAERSKQDVESWRRTASEHGAKQVETLEELLKNVDGVMVLNINGHRHLELSIGPIARGMPTYIDKPLTCSLDQDAGQLSIKSAEAGIQVSPIQDVRADAESGDDLRIVGEVWSRSDADGAPGSTMSP